MRKFNLLLMLLFFPLTAPAAVQCQVVAILDGDTLHCLTSTKTRLKVRLDQIDAPEKGQPFGAVSRRALSDLTYGRSVTLQEHGSDRYGRTLAEVYANGRNVNLIMVEKGMAWAYARYVRDRAYFVAQKTAQAQRAGLWRDPTPIPPSEWRGAKSR